MSLLRLFPLNRRVAGSLLLILALLASSLAWVSPAVQAAPQQQANRPRVVLNAWIAGSHLYVKASNLPARHTFVLRARLASEHSWTKLARLQANNRGVLDTSVRLTSHLAQADRLKVCLKDVRTNRLFCTKARRQ